MRTESPAIIFSVYRSKVSETINKANHVNAGLLLKSHGIRFAECDGVYKGQHEKSYLVLCTDPDAERVVRNLATWHLQESVLAIDANRNARLETPAGSLIAELGRFVNVPESVAVREDGYTALSGQFFICREEYTGGYCEIATKPANAAELAK